MRSPFMQMEGVTQQSAALVEQATASTLAFEEQAAALLAAGGASGSCAVSRLADS